MLIKSLVIALSCLLLLQNATQVQMVVEPEERITDRLLFVVDRSGSMHGDAFSQALNVVTQTLQTPVDHFEIGVIAFNDGAIRWPGKPEPKAPKPVPEGWAGMPSQDNLKAVQDWLANLGAGGDTLIMPALRQALNDTRERLTIILITDGLFGRERTDDILTMIRDLQEQRIKNKLQPAVIVCYGIGLEQRILKAIAELGKGGYLLESTAILEEPDPVPVVPPK